MTRKLVTLRDVAAQANVSISTVSRLINNKNTVVPIAEETRVRVLKAAQELGYRPNRLARGLITSKTNIVGIHLPLFHPVDVEHPESISLEDRMGFAVVGAFVEGIQSLAYPRSYDLHLYRRFQHESEVTHKYAAIGADFVDGMIFALPVADKEFHRFVEERPVPVVSILFHPPNAPCSSVYIDGQRESYRLVTAWLEKGHRRIAVVTPQSHDPEVISSHVEGCRQAVADADLDPNSVLHVVQGDLEGGPDEVSRMVFRSSPKPTAVFVGRANHAAPVLQAARGHGLKCPEDFEIVVWCDDHALELTDPPLSALDVPFARLGAEAARLLFSHLDEGQTDLEHMAVPCTFRERASSRIL